MLTLNSRKAWAEGMKRKDEAAGHCDADTAAPPVEKSAAASSGHDHREAKTVKGADHA